MRMLRQSIVDLPLSNTYRLIQLSKALSSITSLLPRILGSSAGTLILMASRRYGRELNIAISNSLKKALIDFSRSTSWGVEVYSSSSEVTYLLIRECPIRQVCYFEGFDVGGLLCNVTRGVIEGYLSRVLNKNVVANYRQLGPNACLYEVRGRSVPLGVREGRFKIYEYVVREGVEYAKLVEDDLKGVIKLISDLIRRCVGKQAFITLNFSSRRYGLLRSSLYSRCGSTECALEVLNEELGFISQCGINYVCIRDCPLSELGIDELCTSMIKFIEGFLTGVTGKEVVVRRVREGGMCKLFIDWGDARG